MHVACLVVGIFTVALFIRSFDFLQGDSFVNSVLNVEKFELRNFCRCCAGLLTPPSLGDKYTNSFKDMLGEQTFESEIVEIILYISGNGTRLFPSKVAFVFSKETSANLSGYSSYL